MAELKEVLKLYMKQSCTKISTDLPLSYQLSSTMLQLPRSKITKCRKVCLHTSSGETDTTRRILKPLHHHYHIYRNPRRRRQRKVLHTTTTTTFTTEELRCVKTRQLLQDWSFITCFNCLVSTPALSWFWCIQMIKISTLHTHFFCTVTSPRQTLLKIVNPNLFIF